MLKPCIINLWLLVYNFMPFDFCRYSSKVAINNASSIYDPFSHSCKKNVKLDIEMCKRGGGGWVATKIMKYRLRLWSAQIKYILVLGVYYFNSFCNLLQCESGLLYCSPLNFTFQALIAYLKCIWYTDCENRNT